VADYFLDSSAFVKRYHPEAGTDKVLALSNDPQNRILISRLTLVETRSAFAVKVRTGHIREVTAVALWIQLLADLASGIFELLAITNAHYLLADELIGRYGFRYRLRTLDALQLAVVLSQSKYSAIDGFVLADQVLFEVASVEKLPTIPLL
jgi:predicted nucleic acid-binding protein